MKKTVALILLVLIVLGMGHSTYSMFQGRLVEATLIFPLLIIGYLWVAAQNRADELLDEEQAEQEEEEEPDETNR